MIYIYPEGESIKVIGCSLNASSATIRVNLNSTPHPQPLSHAGERGARQSGSPSSVQQKRSILIVVERIPTHTQNSKQSSDSDGFSI